MTQCESRIRKPRRTFMYESDGFTNSYDPGLLITDISKLVPE